MLLSVAVTLVVSPDIADVLEVIFPSAVVTSDSKDVISD